MRRYHAGSKAQQHNRENGYPDHTDIDHATQRNIYGDTPDMDEHASYTHFYDYGFTTISDYYPNLYAVNRSDDPTYCNAHTDQDAATECNGD